MIETPNTENSRRKASEQDAATPQGRPDRTAARITRVCHILIMVYAGLALGIVVRSVIVGDHIGALIGFLGLGAVSVAVFGVNLVSHFLAGLSDVTASLEEIRTGLTRIEQKTPSGQTDTTEPTCATLNLAALGKGDPSVLAGARLDRSAFPRLVATMENEPPAESALDPAPTDDGVLDKTTSSTASTGVATKDLLQMWQVARRSGDLPTCLRIYAALVDTADAAVVAPLAAQLQHLRKQVEESLREAFSRHVRERDYAAALRVGEQICDLCPDEKIAREFERIKPHLLRRVV